MAAFRSVALLQSHLQFPAWHVYYVPDLVELCTLAAVVRDKVDDVAIPVAPTDREPYATFGRFMRHRRVAKTRRNLPTALDPQIKATNFLNNIQAKREAIAAGAFDSILLNWESHLTECTVSNLFFVQAGRLCTPALSCGLLDGITRDIVLNLARELQISVEEGSFGVEAIHKADECFVTNTSMEVMPVTRVDGHPIGNGIPGPLTQQLHRQFAANRRRFLEP